MVRILETIVPEGDTLKMALETGRCSEIVMTVRGSDVE